MSFFKYNYLLKMNKRIIILYLILNCFVYSQFYDVTLSYEANISIKDEHRYILEEFNETVINYYKHTNYTSEYDFLDIPLNINIIYHKINSIDENTHQGFECQLLLSNNKDQYYVTKNITIPYYKGRDIYYNSMIFDKVASIFDYYAYMFIANELDTYGKYLGEQHYNLALTLTNLGTETNNARQWEINKKLLENILQNNYLRNIKYNFFYILDTINTNNQNIKLIKESLQAILNDLKTIYEKYGFEKETLKFIQFYKLELADLFEIFKIKSGINFLIKFDYKNKEIYEKFIR